MKLKNIVTASFFLSLVACGTSKEGSELAESISKKDRLELKLLESLQRQLSALPTQGEAAKRPWNGFYWPHQMGSFSRPVLGEIAPLEKWKAVFPQSRLLELAAVPNPDRIWWEGWCNSVASASIHVDEPTETITYKGTQFYPHDIKALYAAVYGTATSKTKFFYGQRFFEDSTLTDKNGRPKDRSKRDLDPGTFHLLITNLIGQRKESFLIDTVAGREVLVFPVFKYESSIIGQIKDASRLKQLKRLNLSATKFFDVKTTITMSDSHSTLVVDKAPHKLKFHKMELEYVLELDSSGRIVGGEWKNHNQHPDFAYSDEALDLQSDSAGKELLSLIAQGKRTPYDPARHLAHSDAKQDLKKLE